MEKSPVEISIPRRRKTMGCIYRRKGILWIKYYSDGKPFYESTDGDDRQVAEDLLEKREGEVGRGDVPKANFRKVTFEDLAKDYLADYVIQDNKTLGKAECCVEHLRSMFGGRKAIKITTPLITKYIQMRLAAGKANATINRELAALKRMYNIAFLERTPPNVPFVPFIPMLKERNTRKGYFKHQEYLKLLNVSPKWLKPVITFAYRTGWRREEILSLIWEQVDLDEGTVDLDPGEQKNEEARTLYLEEDLLEILENLYEGRKPDCSFVFQRDGEKIGDFRIEWDEACEKTGLWAWDDKKGRMAPTKIFHDFRRTAIRNMLRAGILEKVAMKISGHKTRSVFDRYNITAGNDLKEAADKRKAYDEFQTSRLQRRLQSASDKKKAADELSATR
jgi:integrase